MLTIELNDQQQDFVVMFLNDVIDDPKYSQTSKAIAKEIIKKIKLNDK